MPSCPEANKGCLSYSLLLRRKQKPSSLLATAGPLATVSVRVQDGKLKPLYVFWIEGV